MATEYRSTGDKGRRDEWGSADVDDVLNLATVAKALGYIDMERMFMLGVSRGGMMTYLALKNKMLVKPAAVIAGAMDLEAWAKYGPEFVTGDDCGPQKFDSTVFNCNVTLLLCVETLGNPARNNNSPATGLL